MADGAGGPHYRAHQGILAVLRPSEEADEFATLSGRTYDWQALREAHKQFRDHLAPAISAGVKERLVKLHFRSAGERKATKQRLRQEITAALLGDQEAKRHQARDLYELVKLYRKHRARIQALPAGQRSGAVKALIKAYVSSDPSALAALEGRAAEFAAKRKAEFELRRRRQYVDMLARECGVKRAPRRPYTRMQFPKSAADPIKDFFDVYAEARAAWATTREMVPGLEAMKPKDAAAIALSGTKLMRPETEMWHSRKAVATVSDYEKDKLED